MLGDDLTGLFNRRGLQLVGKQALYKARRDGIGVVLLYLDLDGLKGSTTSSVTRPATRRSSRSPA